PRSTGHKTARQRAGARAEEMAAAFLEARGLEVVERNFRLRRGEVDIVARDGEALVFVEVRLRRRDGYGGAGASSTAAKRARLIAAAALYLARAGADRPCRFDAILMDALDDARIEWIRDAWS